MRGSPSIPPTAPEPYTGCPYCTPYLKRQELLEELGFLPPDAVPAMDPDDIDGNMWNDYYWGYSEISRSERSTIIRPLPPSITERIALEIFERIIGFVQYDTSALYNCAVVCCAWYHCAQPLLYSRLTIQGRAAYNSLVRPSTANRGSRQYLAETSILHVEPLEYQKPKGYCLSIPLVLGRLMCSLKCLTLVDSIRAPYHSSFAPSFRCFPALIHLTLSSFRLYSFTDLRRIICELPNLRDLNLSNGRLISRAGAANPPSIFLPMNAPRLSKVRLESLDAILFSKLAHWMTSTEICHNCTSLSLWVITPQEEGPRLDVDAMLQKLGPSLVSLDYQGGFWNYLDILTCCTRLSTVTLEVTVDSMYSWLGIVTALHEILSCLSSPAIHTLQVRLCVQTSPYRFSVTGHSESPDSEFGTIDLRSIHDLMNRPLFDSLQSSSILITHFFNPSRLACDAVLTAEQMMRRLRWILEPWDKRGILTVGGYNEDTDGEFLQAESMYRRYPQEDAAEDGEEAQSSEDNTIRASDQEDEHGLEGAVRDSVGDGED